MIRILPFILIPVLVLGGLWYWRSVSSKPTPVDSGVSVDQVAVEVPKTLPAVTSTPTPAPTPTTRSTSDPRVAVLETAVTDLKARILALEKAPPVPAAAPVYAAKAPLYIPLGASGGPWLYADFTSLNEYQVSVNPDDYTGYSGMQLEVNFRLIGNPGTGYIRLYNLTDRSAIASDISTANTVFGVVTSAAFKLPNGQKLYTIQVKSTNSQDLYIQSVRIKVNF